MNSEFSNVLTDILFISETRTALQQSSCIFFASMALADLGVTVLGMLLSNIKGLCLYASSLPVMIPTAVMEVLQRWPLGATMCQVGLTLAKIFSHEPKFVEAS